MRQRHRRALPALLVLVALTAVGCSGGGDGAGDQRTGAAATDGSGSAPITASPSESVPPEVSSTSTAGPKPRLSTGACPIFPADNIWHRDVPRLPVRSNSAAVIANIGLDDTMHADFGSGLWDGGPIGIPITTIRSGQAKVRVSFEYAGETREATARLLVGSAGTVNVSMISDATASLVAWIHAPRAMARSSNRGYCNASAVHSSGKRTNRCSVPGWGRPRRPSDKFSSPIKDGHHTSP